MNKKSLVVGLGMTLVLAVAITPMSAQERRWDGADDLPVNPLACPGEEMAMDMEGEGMEMPEYDGGLAQTPPTRPASPLRWLTCPS